MLIEMLHKFKFVYQYLRVYFQFWQYLTGILTLISTGAGAKLQWFVCNNILSLFSYGEGLLCKIKTPIVDTDSTSYFLFIFRLKRQLAVGLASV